MNVPHAGNLFMLASWSSVASGGLSDIPGVIKGFGESRGCFRGFRVVLGTFQGVSEAFRVLQRSS